MRPSFGRLGARGRDAHALLGALSFSLLVCAGVGERFYVLFVLPLCRLEDEAAYKYWYSRQFQAATLLSWAMGLVLFRWWRVQRTVAAVSRHVSRKRVK